MVHHAEDATEKLIFVMSPSKTLYVALKERSRFHHSSFLSGGPALAAGAIQVRHSMRPWLGLTGAPVSSLCCCQLRTL